MSEKVTKISEAAKAGDVDALRELLKQENLPAKIKELSDAGDIEALRKLLKAQQS